MDWHVPIDDTHHWKYTMAFRRSGALADREMRDRRAAIGEDYHRTRTAANRYLQDRDEMNRGDLSRAWEPIFWTTMDGRLRLRDR